MTTPTGTEDDEFTELVAAKFSRVDLVGNPANGSQGFLIMKQDADAGMLDAEYVRSLISKEATVPGDTKETVTMSGSPAAIAKLIHGAPIRGTTPDTGSDEKVSKDMAELDEGAAGLDPTVPLATPDDDAPGDPNDPGSPAWEAVDAATARKWTSILTRARTAVSALADREMLEAAVADPDDAGHAFELYDAWAAIDYAISVLAPFAVNEQAEVDCGTAAMEAVTKAMTGFDPGPLDEVEVLAAVAKAGRVLSTANEDLIREAAGNLQRVLAALPQAPASEDVSKEAKEAGMTGALLETGQPSVVAKTGDDTPVTVDAVPDGVVKADGDGEKTPMQAVFDQNGDLIGIVDPAAITPVAGASKPDADADADDTDTTEAEPEAEPATDGDDLTPQPAADTGTPADQVTKADTGDDEITVRRDVLKSAVAEAVSEALASQETTHQAVVAKMAAETGVAVEEIQALKARIEMVENTPAAPRVFANGQVPPAHMLRGQDQGAVPVDVAKARELKDTLYRGSAPEQNAAFTEMQEMAVAKLASMHRR